ncbi:hypothetical protein P3T25_005083 [Paraburkholderia sp. GAS32]
MKVPSGQIRVKLPQVPCHCRVESCVYNKDGVCDEPRINRANSDSACHRITPRQVIADYLISTVEAQSLN